MYDIEKKTLKIQRLISIYRFCLKFEFSSDNVNLALDVGRFLLQKRQILYHFKDKTCILSKDLFNLT